METREQEPKIFYHLFHKEGELN